MSSRALVALLTILSCFCLAGCARDKAEFEKAQETDTIEAYQNFIQSFADSDFVLPAKERIETIAFETASDEDTEHSFQSYLEDYPDSHLAAKARDRAATHAFTAAAEANTEESYLAFAEDYPQSELITEVMGKAAELAFKSAEEQPSEAGYLSFVERYPGSVHEGEARARAASLGFESAYREYSTQAFRRFISAHGGSPLEKQAAAVLEDIEAGRYVAPKGTFISESRLKTVFNWNGKYDSYVYGKGGGNVTFQSNGKLLAGAWGLGNLKFPNSVTLVPGGIRLTRGAVMLYPKK